MITYKAISKPALISELEILDSPAPCPSSVSNHSALPTADGWKWNSAAETTTACSGTTPKSGRRYTENY